MIHTTIGIYLSGEFVINGVRPEHLEDHVAYNIANRWGRALIVDGKIVHNGYLSIEECKEFLKNHPDLTVTRASEIYR